jgi:hypothetical protein
VDAAEGLGQVNVQAGEQQQQQQQPVSGQASQQLRQADSAEADAMEIDQGGGFLRDNGGGNSCNACSGATAAGDAGGQLEAAAPQPLQRVGKQVLARRKQAFRRALTFAVVLIHRRFLATPAGRGTRWLVQDGGTGSGTGGGESVQALVAPPAAATARSAKRGRRQPSAGGLLAKKEAVQGGSAPGLAGGADNTAAQAAAVRRASSRAAAVRARQQVALQLGGGYEAQEEERDEAASPPPSKRRRWADAAGSDANGGGGGSGSGCGSGGGSGWDPLERRAWHPQFDVERITLGELRSAAAEHRGWLAARLHPGTGGAAAGDGPAAPPRVVKRHERCTATVPLEPRGLLAHLKELPWYDGQVAHVRELPGRAPRRAVPQARLAPAVLAALESRGIDASALREGAGGSSGGMAGAEATGASSGPSGDGSGSGVGPGESSGEGRGLFTHQAAAIDALLVRRHHVVVATATASGKSAAYNVPVLQALAEDPSACALYMFPTKVGVHSCAG